MADRIPAWAVNKASEIMAECVSNGGENVAFYLAKALVEVANKREWVFEHKNED